MLNVECTKGKVKLAVGGPCAEVMAELFIIAHTLVDVYCDVSEGGNVASFVQEILRTRPQFNDPNRKHITLSEEDESKTENQKIKDFLMSGFKKALNEIEQKDDKPTSPIEKIIRDALRNATIKRFDELLDESLDESLGKDESLDESLGKEEEN